MLTFRQTSTGNRSVLVAELLRPLTYVSGAEDCSMIGPSFALTALPKSETVVYIP